MTPTSWWAQCLHPFLGSTDVWALLLSPYLQSFTVLQNMWSCTAQILTTGIDQYGAWRTSPPCSESHLLSMLPRVTEAFLSTMSQLITLHCCQLKASCPGKAFIHTSTPKSTCSGGSYVGHWHVFQLNFLLGCPTILDFLCLLGPKSELLSINYFPLLPVIHKWHIIQPVDEHREQGRALHHPEPIPLQTEMNTSFSQLLKPQHQAHDLHLSLKGIMNDLTNAC